VTFSDPPSPANSAKSPYPFERTACACRLCTINCEHLPGALAPSDLGRIAAHLGYDDNGQFARECLLASDGAKVATRDGKVISLPTLVPSNGQDNACRFLRAGRCTIHAISPFGCAYIDAHMTDAEFRRRADTLHGLLLEDQKQQGEYSRLCGELRAEGLEAPPLATRRYRLSKAIRKEFGRTSSRSGG
jgi:hypothetical protein